MPAIRSVASILPCGISITSPTAFGQTEQSSTASSTGTATTQVISSI